MLLPALPNTGNLAGTALGYLIDELANLFLYGTYPQMFEAAQSIGHQPAKLLLERIETDLPAAIHDGSISERPRWRPWGFRGRRCRSSGPSPHRPCARSRKPAASRDRTQHAPAHGRSRLGVGRDSRAGVQG